MSEHVKDANALIESWKESFDMELRDDGKWHFEDGFGDHYDALLTEFRALLRKWNSFVPEYNAIAAPKPAGRPLDASPAQCVEVLKLRNRKLSLREIADETSLSLNTVRTIIDRNNRTDRSTIKRLQKLDPMNAAAVSSKARKRTRNALPDRINKLSADGVDVLKEAKGLGRK